MAVVNTSSTPFLYSSSQRMGEMKNGRWRSWWQGVWRLGESGVVRWHCPHRHRTEDTALDCSRREVRRKFGGPDRVRGMFT